MRGGVQEREGSSSLLGVYLHPVLNRLHSCEDRVARGPRRARTHSPRTTNLLFAVINVGSEVKCFSRNISFDISVSTQPGKRIVLER